jgi:VWFA-related protein
VRIAHAIVTISALASTGSAATADDPRVYLVRPRDLSTVIGPTPIRAVVRVADGAAIERLEILVDGRPVGVLTAPPWEVEWDAGDGLRDHRIEAVLHTRDGRTAATAIRTSALRVDEAVRVDLVNLYLVVRDAEGRYVPDLARESFRVLENRREQVISRFSATYKPLRVGLVLDTSWSMRGAKLEQAKEAALQFLEILEPDDEGLVVTFADGVEIAQPLTSDRRLLAAAIEAAAAGGGTALYDAVWRTARLLDSFDGRRVLVLLSDGRDEASSGFEPGSLHTLDEAIEQTLRAEVMVFAVALGSDLRKEHVRVWNVPGGVSRLDPELTVLGVLERMSGSSGGRTVLASAAGRLRKAFDDVATDLRNQYSVAYVSDDPTRDGKWRRIDVLVPDRDLEVITRKGYYAPQEAD